MQYHAIFDANAEVEPKYISFAAGTELRPNPLRRDGSAGTQFMGNYFKVKARNRQLLSRLGFAIQHGKALTHLKEREALVKRVDDAPANLGVACVERDETEFAPSQPRWLFADTGLRAGAESEGAFVGTI